MNKSKVGLTRARIIAEARALLPVVGLTGLTYSRLAAKADVTRQTIYRHWPQRQALLVDLVLLGPEVGYPERFGSPVDRLVGFLKSLRDGLSVEATASSLLVLASQAGHDAVCAKAIDTITNDRLDALNHLLNLDAKVTLDEFAQLVGPVIYKRAILRQDLEDQWIRSFVEQWWNARRD